MPDPQKTEYGVDRKERSNSKKSKVMESAGKVMATVFWDAKGVVLIDYLPHGTTITAAHYCEVLQKLRRRSKIKGGVSWQK